MAMKKQEEPPKGSPAWMATFSDLMNLLLCFFVLLFSMSSINAEKFQEVAASLASSFNILSDTSTSLGDGILIDSGVNNLGDLSEYYSNMGLGSGEESEELMDAYEQIQEGMIEESEHISESVSDKIGDMNISNQVEVIASSQYVALNLKSGILFDSGKAELKGDAKELLVKVGEVLEDYDGYTIEIIGHTDNLPTTGTEYPNNMILSLYRAYSVYEFLTTENNLDKKNVKAVGRGEEVPIASNDTDAGRAQNRRVEIRIYNKLSGM